MESAGSFQRNGLEQEKRYVILATFVLSIDQENQMYRPLNSTVFQCKIEGPVLARWLSYLWKGQDLGTLKGPGSWITPEVCKDSSLTFDKGGLWGSRTQISNSLFHQP